MDESAVFFFSYVIIYLVYKSAMTTLIIYQKLSNAKSLNCLFYLTNSLKPKYALFNSQCCDKKKSSKSSYWRSWIMKDLIIKIAAN